MKLNRFFHTASPGMQLDLWSGWHFFGSYFLASWVGWWALLAGFFWEIFDGVFRLFWVAWYDSHQPGEPALMVKLEKVFDHRGFGWVDLLLDAAAVTVWMIFKN
jgi:hypothetical protein